jgi:hypothetical protein
MDRIASGQDVRRRRVFYIPGYDPFPARRYREFYRKEGAAQAAISKYDIEIDKKRTAGRFGWHVRSTQEGMTTASDIEVLVWSDIVRDSMSGSVAGTYRDLVRTAWTYVASGTLRRLMWLRKGPVIAALYPVGMLLLQLVVALAAGAVAAAALLWGLGAILSVAGWSLASLGPVPLILRWGVIVAVAVPLLRWFKRLDRRFYAYYLMQDYAFSASLRGRTPPALTGRLAEFRDELVTALLGGYDEVLIVGHSSGAHLAVELLADHLRAAPVRRGGPALGLLTLGQVIPMVSFLPEADKLRADLAFLAGRSDITWVDVTAPGDGCAFALCDPVAVSGVAPPRQRWPLVFSAAFTQSLSAERWEALRWKFFHLHFQYLFAFDRPGDYDYFRITAGPLSLARRFADKKPSPLRIDVAASKYTSTDA